MDNWILVLYSSGNSHRALIEARYIPYSETYNKWRHPSKDDVTELVSSWLKPRHLHLHQFDWSILHNGCVVYEMMHNPESLPEDLFD